MIVDQRSIDRSRIRHDSLHQKSGAEVKGADIFGVNTQSLESSEIEQLDQLVSDFSDVFSTGKHDLGQANWTYHWIDTGHASPIKQTPCRLPIHHQQKVGEMICDMEQQASSSHPIHHGLPLLFSSRSKMGLFVSVLIKGSRTLPPRRIHTHCPMLMTFWTS